MEAAKLESASVESIVKYIQNNDGNSTIEKEGAIGDITVFLCS